MGTSTVVITLVIVTVIVVVIVVGSVLMGKILLRGRNMGTCTVRNGGGRAMPGILVGDEWMEETTRPEYPWESDEEQDVGSVRSLESVDSSFERPFPTNNEGVSLARFTATGTDMITVKETDGGQVDLAVSLIATQSDSPEKWLVYAVLEPPSYRESESESGSTRVWRYNPESRFVSSDGDESHFWSVSDVVSIEKGLALSKLDVAPLPVPVFISFDSAVISDSTRSATARFFTSKEELVRLVVRIKSKDFTSARNTCRSTAPVTWQTRTSNSDPFEPARQGETIIHSFRLHFLENKDNH
jgi:hypothetical protein